MSGLARSTSQLRGSIIRAVTDAADGHVYYVIAADAYKGVANVIFVDWYASLNNYAPAPAGGGTAKPDGFFFVRNAAGDATHSGDPTVHAGWAMYIWDDNAYQKYKPKDNAGWVKIAQQSDTDWDIDDELKAMFVLKSVYNARVNEVDNRFTRDEEIINGFDTRIYTIEKDWDSTKYPEGVGVLQKAHVHDNKTVIDELSDSGYGQLCYLGKPISGNSFVYDHVEDGEITWCDPTISSTEWTHEVVKNSDVIAQKILGTQIARVGLSLFVMEVDGSVTIYKYIRTDGLTDWVTVAPVNFPTIEDFDALPENTVFQRASTATAAPVWSDTTREAARSKLQQLYGGVQLLGGPTYRCAQPAQVLSYKFAQTVVPGNHGVAEYVDTLPTATKWHYCRGCWVPLQDDGVHVVGHLHKCVEYVSTYTAAAGTVYNSSYLYFTKSGDTYTEITNHNLIVRGSDDCVVPAEDQYNLDYLPVYYATSSDLAYKWLDINSDNAQVSLSGAAVTICYSEPETMWTTNYIFWKDPADTTVSGKAVNWKSTKLVRKYGSWPTNMNDGVVVTTTFDRDKYDYEPFKDVVPHTQEKVFYRLFSTSKAGDTYTPTDGAEASKMDWTYLLNVMSAGRADRLFHTKRYVLTKDVYAQAGTTYYTRSGEEGSYVYTAATVTAGTTRVDTGTYYVFEPNSIIVLPYHNVYGYIECEVIGVNQDNAGTSRNGLLVVSKNVLCNKVVDATEPSVFDGNLNPEYQGAAYGTKGSNGEIDIDGATYYHWLDSLNVIRWLNSTYESWFTKQTYWDVDPNYTLDSGESESGFLYGFEETDRNIFLTLSIESDGYSKLEIHKVSLPFKNGQYFDNITKTKTLNGSASNVAWVTGTGVAGSAGERSRINDGFYRGDDTSLTIPPQESVGIVPMFFIGPS